MIKIGRITNQQIGDYLKGKWQGIASFALNLIKSDMDSKILQGVKESDSYKSSQYIAYKANDMRKLGRKKAKSKGGTGKGGRLAKYYGKAIESHEVSSVNMILTGELKKSLKARGYEDYALIAAPLSQYGKLAGNELLGREIVNLREKNQNAVADYIKKIFEDEFDMEWDGEVEVAKIEIELKL